ncbi:uncharacterized protein PHALS_11769 [Plasmopara halstedii]|uniref:WRKY19-like zinc finger domain-containing protein n=1 Tax=Plasmopara halstedii TaxID=4781 RepID=A0A0P1AJJ4_PLAHL|nr:uncharacterized protein PHALS_11769 [Plasmopara halstedii]CEG41420.1 hypothetical protein PHALS_11769 [Plasmopara halstedii]|eukprot:XP_024577789.1 hypothetical protein PHALS_11769 [Plasmopara halstedii]
MQVGSIDSSRLAPLLHAISMPSELYPFPQTYPTIRLPSLAPRLPTLPSLMTTLAAQGSYTGSSSNLSPSNTSSSISYILNPPTRQAVEVSHHMIQHQLYLPTSSSNVVYHPYRNTVPSVPSSMQSTETKTQPKKKRKTRICKSEGCEKYVVDRGLCIRHGGGKRCSVEDCNCRAQNRGLCWKHGGYTRCTVEGCTKRAKSRGICWSHGGGTRCKHGGCSKIAVSHGLCWAHGGGKRCLVDSCHKPAYERNGNLCAEHGSQRTQREQTTAAFTLVTN